MNKRYEVREQIEDIIHQFLHRKLNVDQLCESILALDGIAIVAREAELPENPYPPSEGGPPFSGARMERWHNASIYEKAQQDMLEEGWVKEVGK